MPRVLSLNVTDGGRTLHPALAARLDELAPDLVTLQEIRNDTTALWRRTLGGAGMQVCDTCEHVRQHGLPPPRPPPQDPQPTPRTPQERAAGPKPVHVLVRCSWLM